MWGRTYNTYRLLLEYGSPCAEYASPSSTEGAAQLVRLPVAVATVAFEFTAEEPAEPVIERFGRVKDGLLSDRSEERVCVSISASDARAHATFRLAASSSGGAEGGPSVRLQLTVARYYPVLRCVQLSRVSGTGVAPEAVVKALLAGCDLTTVWKLKGEGMLHACMRMDDTHGRARSARTHMSARQIAAASTHTRQLLAWHHPWPHCRHRGLWQLVGVARHNPRLVAAAQPQPVALRAVGAAARDRHDHDAQGAHSCTLAADAL